MQLNDIPDSPNTPQMQDDIDNVNVCMISTIMSLNEIAELQNIIILWYRVVTLGCAAKVLEVLNTVCPMCRTRNIVFQRIYFYLLIMINNNCV